MCSVKNVPCFQKWFYLINIILIASTTYAISEINFSTLKRVKTSILSTMTDSRLNHLLMIHTYSEELHKINIKLIINKFSNTLPKMNFFFQDFFSKCDQIRSFTGIYTNAVLKICQYLHLHMKICWRFHIKTPSTFWDMRTWDLWIVCLQTFRNNIICQKLAYFLRNLQFLRVNNSRILWIQNAKFSGCFYEHKYMVRFSNLH